MLLFNADLSVVDFCKENGVVLGLPFSRSRIESMFVDLPSSLTLSCKKIEIKIIILRMERFIMMITYLKSMNSRQNIQQL